MNARESKQFTALHMAAITNNIDIVRLLVGNGTDVNSVNFEKMTPLK